MITLLNPNLVFILFLLHNHHSSYMSASDDHIHLHLFTFMIILATPLVVSYFRCTSHHSDRQMDSWSSSLRYRHLDCPDKPLWVRSVRCAGNALRLPPMGSTGSTGTLPSIDPFRFGVIALLTGFWSGFSSSRNSPQYIRGPSPYSHKGGRFWSCFSSLRNNWQLEAIAY